jgi:hypothetical protein
VGAHRGLAISVRSVPRFTKDLDFAVAVAGDPEAEDVVHRLGGRGYRPVEVLEQDYAERMSGVRLERGGSDVVVDLLFASSGIEAEVVAAAARQASHPGRQALGVEGQDDLVDGVQPPLPLLDDLRLEGAVPVLGPAAPTCVSAGIPAETQAQVIRECRSDGRSLADRLGGGGEHREVTVGLTGRGRVVGGVNVEDIDGVQPARAVAQFVA